MRFKTFEAGNGALLAARLSRFQCQRAAQQKMAEPQSLLPAFVKNPKASEESGERTAHTCSGEESVAVPVSVPCV